MLDVYSQLPTPWANIGRQHGLMFAWAHNGSTPSGAWVEIRSGGVLGTKWGDGTWADFPGIPNRLDLTFGSAQHVCHLAESGCFEVVQRMSKKTGKELGHPRVNGVHVTTMGWPSTLQPPAKRGAPAPSTPPTRVSKREVLGNPQFETPPKTLAAKRRRCGPVVERSVKKQMPRASVKKESAVATAFGGSWSIEVNGHPWGKAYVGATSAYFTLPRDQGGVGAERCMHFQIQGDGSPEFPFCIEDGSGYAHLASSSKGVREWTLINGGRSVWRHDEQASWCDSFIEDKDTPPMSRCLTRALAALRPAAGNGRLSGRESEQADIEHFLTDAVSTGGRSQVLYVSGMPGTGKTASVLEVVARLERASETARLPKFTFLHVNGMCSSSPISIFSDILQQLQAHRKGFARAPMSGNRAYDELTKLFSGRDLGEETIVLLIDEIDSLVTQGQAVLYQLFDWMSLPNARLALVSIANTMDLPERLLPRISSRLAVVPVNFAAYDRPQLREIMTHRLWLAKAEGAFTKDALEICAARVAAASGDARKALQVCRRAIEIQLEECSANELGPVTLQHVAAAEESLLRVNPASKSIEGLSLKARRLLLAIVLEVKRSEKLLVPLRDALRRYVVIMTTSKRRESGDSCTQQMAESMPSEHAEDAQFILQRLEAMRLLCVHCTGSMGNAQTAVCAMTMESSGQEVMLGLGDSLDADDVADALSGCLEDDMAEELLGGNVEAPLPLQQ